MSLELLADCNNRTLEHCEAVVQYWENGVPKPVVMVQLHVNGNVEMNETECVQMSAEEFRRWAGAVLYKLGELEAML